MRWAVFPSIPMHFDSLKVVSEHLVERIKLEDTVFRDTSQNVPTNQVFASAPSNTAAAFNSWGVPNPYTVNRVTGKIQQTGTDIGDGGDSLNRQFNKASGGFTRNMNNNFMCATMSTMFLMNETLQQSNTHQSHINTKKHDIFNIGCEKNCNCESTNSVFRAGNSLMFGPDKHVTAKHFMTPCGPLQLTAQECGEFLLKKASVSSNLLGSEGPHLGQPIITGNNSNLSIGPAKSRQLDAEADDTQSSSGSAVKLNVGGGHKYRLDKERPFSCQECGKSFLLKHHLVTHARVHTGERPHVCPECGKSFAHKHCLSTHLLLHSSERPYKCMECKKSFTLKHHLVTHARVHSRDRPFICQECGRTFPQKRHLVTHAKFHSGERPYVCDECGESFSQKDHLVIHSRFHGGLHPYVCPDCGSTFTRKFELVNHGRLHGRVPHSCEICGKEFLQKRTLLAHTRLHTGDERPFVCQHCGEAFSRKPELIEHSKVHAGDKPFVCRYNFHSFYLYVSYIGNVFCFELLIVIVCKLEQLHNICSVVYIRKELRYQTLLKISFYPIETVSVFSNFISKPFVNI